MPCGPTAMKLIPMVDISEGADEQRMSIAKLLTVIKILMVESPLLIVTDLLCDLANFGSDCGRKLDG